MPASKNFQHLEAIADLKRALALQNNLAHAYNRLSTILASLTTIASALSPNLNWAGSY